MLPSLLSWIQLNTRLRPIKAKHWLKLEGQGDAILCLLSRDHIMYLQYEFIKSISFSQATLSFLTDFFISPSTHPQVCLPIAVPKFYFQKLSDNTCHVSWEGHKILKKSPISFDITTFFRTILVKWQLFMIIPEFVTLLLLKKGTLAPDF